LTADFYIVGVGVAKTMNTSRDHWSLQITIEKNRKIHPPEKSQIGLVFSTMEGPVKIKNKDN